MPSVVTFSLISTTSRRVAIVVTLFVLLWQAGPAAAHEDLLVQRTDPGGSNRLVTGTVDLDALEAMVPARVYEAELSFNAATLSFSGDEPGFNAFSDASPLKPAGTFALPGDTALRFLIQPFEINSQTSDLFLWDGLGAVDFAPAGPTATLSFVGAVANDPLANKLGTIDVTSGAGALHRHHDFGLTNSVTDTTPPAGVYLLQMILEMDGVNDSAPFWFVVGTEGTSHESHEAAVDWVQANLVPEPAAWLFALVGSAGLALIGRRRSMSRNQQARK